MTCYCESCCETPRPTYTREYLLNCLARDIAMTDGGATDAIKTRLARFAETHDADLAEKLRLAVRREWQARRNAG